MRAVNLIPSEQRSGGSVGAGRSEGAAYAVMVVLGGIALLAFLYGRANHQISSSRVQAATLTAQAQRAQAETGHLAPYTSFIALREQRMNAVSELVDSRFDWAHAFHEFGRVLPAEVSVSSLTGTIAGSAPSGAAAAGAPAAVPSTSTSTSTSPSAAPAAASSGAPASAAASAAATVTSATPPGSVPTFTLTGCATSQPAVALMLERLRLIDGVSGVTLQSSTKGSSAAGGGCGAGQPAYAAQIVFDALPTPSMTRASMAAAVLTANAAKGGSTTSTGAGR